MYFGIYAKSTGLIDHYIIAQGYMVADGYIRGIKQSDPEGYFYKLAVDMQYIVKCHACKQPTNPPNILEN
jgi:predicted ATP-grasp superfamily ATP-dependent carboligase